MVSSARWQRLALAGVLALSAFLELFRLQREGFSNLYYAATVKSMLTGWHNLFFASFDPGGFISVDKPPLGLWVQAASAKVLGWHGLSLLLPEALAGVVGVALLYHLVQRAFGSLAGLVAALALAVTPISVATSRNNTPDSLLVLTSLLAAWAFTLAAERGRLRWLVAGAVLVGLGFTIKMLAAFLVLPAFYVLYLVTAPLSRRTRVAHLTLASVVLITVSLGWPLAVDLTPAAARPYVGSSTTNSEFNLMLVYNGLDRLLPGRSLYTGHGPPPPVPTPPPSTNTFPTRGAPGPLRLVNRLFAGQIDWLLPLAGFGFLAAGWAKWRRPRFTYRQRATVHWGVWFVIGAIYFGVSNLFQPYYLVMLAPPLAAMASIGAATLWEEYRSGRRLGWLLPLALLATGAWQVKILADFPAWSKRLTPPLLVVVFLAVAALAVARVARCSYSHVRAFPIVLADASLVLLVAPAVWAAIPVWQGGTVMPLAGPDSQAPGGPAKTAASDESLLVEGMETIPALLATEAAQDRFLVATMIQWQAAPIILETGRPVMNLGGVQGTDPTLTPLQLARLVSKHVVRQFLLLPSAPPWQPGLIAWITAHCTRRRPTGLGNLYVCSSS